MSARATMRVHLGADAIISPSEAAAWLPCRDEVALRWLADEGLIIDHPVLGRGVVWGDVLAAYRRAGQPIERPSPHAPPPCTLPRKPMPGRKR